MTAGHRRGLADLRFRDPTFARFLDGTRIAPTSVVTALGSIP